MVQLLTPDRAAVEAALDGVPDPRTGEGLITAGVVRKLELGFGRVAARLEVPADAMAAYGGVPRAAEEAVRAVPGVRRAHIVLAPATIR
ncbi:MAG: iron-sulfur cluster assembly protein, partial [Pseudomonadota bacterium]|nr:iron-sulfur cluster assembly protein [Pseudomonadota bacterium]